MTSNEKDMLSQMSVLYADDDDFLLSVTTDVLKNYFKNVYAVSNGKKALDIFFKNNIDIVILDNKMPEITGLEVVAKIREIDRSTPIFLTTNYADQEDLRVAVRMNLVDYLIKPLTLPMLENVLKDCLKQIMVDVDNFVYFIRDGLYYDKIGKRVIQDSKSIELTKLEAKFLETLLKNHGRVVENSLLDDIIWDGNMTLPALRNLVARIRKKIQNDFIENVHDMGYIIRK